MSVVSNKGYVHSLNAANDALTGRKVIQAISLTGTANAAATLKDGGDKILGQMYAAANTVQVLSFPEGLRVNGFKVSAISGTNAVVYVYLR